MAIRFSALRQYRLAIVPEVLIVTVLVLTVQSHAASPEQRCTELGANCICSEPFQMTAWSSPQSGYWIPNDFPATKSCTQLPGVTGAVVSTDPGVAPQVGTDATALAALPVGNTIARFAKMNDASQPHGGTDAMHMMSGGITPRKRIAVRWYLYYSPTFNFCAVNTPPCNSGKWMAPRPGFMEMSYSTGSNRLVQYGWAPGGGLDWSGLTTTNSDIAIAPGQDLAFPMATELVGRWWRIELILTNNDSSGTSVIQIFWKDMTTRIEYVVTDTRIGCTSPPLGAGCEGVGGTSAQRWPANPALAPPGGGLDRIGPEFFRNGGPMSGYFGVLNYVMAAWSTDAGQRIGAAREIEGGSTSPNPAAPGFVTVR